MLEIIGKYCKIYKAKVDCYCMFGLRKSHRNASVQIFSRIFVYIHACYRELMDIVSSGKFCKSLEGFEKDKKLGMAARFSVICRNISGDDVRQYGMWIAGAEKITEMAFPELKKLGDVMGRMFMSRAFSLMPLSDLSLPYLDFTEADVTHVPETSFHVYGKIDGGSCICARF